MRLIGNKTRLLGVIESVFAKNGIDGGTLIDVFAGTSSVGQHFKRRGFRVVSNDGMASCYARAVASVEVSRYPRFQRFRRRFREEIESKSFREGLVHQGDFLEACEEGGAQGDRIPVAEAIHYLNSRVEPREGLVYRSFSSGGEANRRYFTPENARRIDGVLQLLRSLAREGDLGRAELYLLLSELISAADRVANISGTYGAFLKSWQASARQPILLRVPEIIASDQRNRAYREDANRFVRRVSGEVLYVDPPYNRRQYPANYHVLEVIAEYHAIDDLERFEADLYGKTGLRPYEDEKSAYCVPVRPRRQLSVGSSGFANVHEAFSDLVLSARTRHVVVSYNEEGLLTRDEIGAILARFEGQASFDWRRGFREVVYKRFRSDRDRAGEDGEQRREYRVMKGKRRDEIGEWLFVASRREAVRSKRSASKRRAGAERQ